MRRAYAADWQAQQKALLNSSRSKSIIFLVITQLRLITLLVLIQVHQRLFITVVLLVQRVLIRVQVKMFSFYMVLLLVVQVLEIISRTLVITMK